MKAGQSALHDFQGLLRLALGASGLIGDAALVLDGLGRHLLAGEVGGGVGGGVDGDVVSGGLGLFGVGAHSHQHAHLGGQILGGAVQVGIMKVPSTRARRRTTTFLAQHSALFGDVVAQGAAVVLGSRRLSEIGITPLATGDPEHGVAQLDELVGLGHEVSLAVDLDHDADAVPWTEARPGLTAERPSRAWWRP